MSSSARSRTAMTPSDWLAISCALACFAVVAAFVRWSVWWPHSDNRQNGVKLFGFVAVIVGAVTFGKAFAAASSSRRVLMLLAAAVAVALGLFVGFALMVDATESAR